MYDVPLATYEDAIEADLAGIDAETVAVDRRGYAPRIAEELGEGYLQNRYIIVDEGQRDADVLDQTAYSFDDQLTAELFQQNEDLLQQALADGPLSVAINIDFQNGAFQVSSLLDDPEIRKTVEEANEFRRNIEALELTDLRDPRELRDRYEQATDLRAELGDIRREFDVALSTVQTDEFSFKHTDATGYVIYADSPLCVLFDGDDVPWDTGSYHATEERNEQLDAVLTSLYEGDKLEVQEEAIIERMKTIAANTLQDDDTAYEQGTVEFYRAVKERKEEMPERWHVLKGLVQDGAVQQALSYQTQDDATEDIFQYMEPQTTRAELVLSHIADFAEDEEQDISILEFVEETDDSTDYTWDITVNLDANLTESYIEDIASYLDDSSGNTKNSLDSYDLLEDTSTSYNIDIYD